MSDKTDYIPPLGYAVIFELKGADYVAPLGNRVTFNLTQNDDVPPEPADTQYVYPQAFDASVFGNAFTRHNFRRAWLLSRGSVHKLWDEV